MQANPITVVPQQPPIPVRKSRCRTLSPEELEARHADPQREEDDGMACRICGMVMKRLTDYHFLTHKLKNKSEYHEHCESNGWGSPLIEVSGHQSAWLARRIQACPRAVRSEIVRLYKQGLSVRKVAKLVHKDVMFVADVITKAGCMRANGEARRGRSTSQSFDNWKALELRIIEEKSTQEIAKEIHRASQSNVTVAFQKMGVSGKRGYVCCSFGEAIDRPVLQRLHKISELTAREFAQQLGMPRVTLRDLLSHTKVPGQDLALGTALKIAKWWKGLFFGLMSNAPLNPRAGEEFGQSSFVLLFFPDLREKKYQLLMQILPRLAEDQQKNLKLLSRHDLQQHLVAQAKRETTEEKAGGSVENLFRRFLIWAPEIMDFLGDKDLRDVDYRPLALKIIARWLHTTEAIVNQVMYPSSAKQIREILPRDMHELVNSAIRPVLAQDQPQPEVSKSENGSNTAGRGRKLTKRHKVFLEARHIHDALKEKYPQPKDPRSSWGAVAKIVDPDEYEKDSREADRLRLGVEHLSKPHTERHPR